MAPDHNVSRKQNLYGLISYDFLLIMVRLNTVLALNDKDPGYFRSKEVSEDIVATQNYCMLVCRMFNKLSYFFLTLQKYNRLSLYSFLLVSESLILVQGRKIVKSNIYTIHFLVKLFLEHNEF